MKRSDAILIAAGLGLFAFVASRIGWTGLLHQLMTASLAIPVLVSVSFLRLLLQTRAWRIALRQEGVKTSFGELLGIRLASQSMGYLSVLGPALSEPMKINLLKGNWNSSATATLADTGVYWFTSALLGLAGCVAAAVLLAGAQNTRMLVGITLLFALLLGLLIRQKSLLQKLVVALGNRAPGWLRKGAALEEEIRSFRRRHPQSVRSMLYLDLLCQILLVAETAVVLSFATLPIHLPILLGIETATRVTKMVAGWLPARIGADEGGTAAAFVAFGLSPATGVVLALTRRFRDLLWCVLGLSWFAWRSRNLSRHQVRDGELVPCNQS
jgi:lysylphosphatidylglycerol synthase-like protein